MPRPRLGLATQIVLAFAAFGLGVGVAELAGAINLGTAFGIGQITFAAACVAMMLKL